MLRLIRLIRLIALCVLSALGLACVSTPPGGDAAAGLMPLWQTEAPRAGLIYSGSADAFVYLSGSTFNPNYSLYSIADGRLLGEYSAKGLQALDMDGGDREQGAGYFFSMRKLERRDGDGDALWTYKGNLFLAGFMIEDGLLIVAERPVGFASKLTLARLDPVTGAVLWRKETPIEAEPSLASIRGPNPDYYHVQMGLVDGRLAVISKGLVLMDPEGGEIIGSVAFSVQTGADAAQGGLAMANSGTLGGVAIGAALAGSARIGEVFPPLAAAGGNLIVHDIKGTVYAIGLSDGRLAWKVDFDRVSAIEVDGASGYVGVVTGLRMVNGLGHAIFDGKPGMAVLDAKTGVKKAELVTGWVVGSVPDSDGGSWLFNESEAILVRAMSIKRRLDLKRDAEIDGAFAVVPIDGGAKAVIFGASSIAVFDPENGTFGSIVKLEGTFHSLQEYAIRGRYLAAEVWPGMVNLQKCAFVCVDLEAGRKLYQVPTGIWKDGRKTKLRQFTLFAEAGIFAMAWREAGRPIIQGYGVFPIDAAKVAKDAQVEVSIAGASVPDRTGEPAAERPRERDGLRPETAFEIPRKTVKIEKKLDSWAGLEPFAEDPFGAAPFLGSVDYAISKVYLCKDDHYLYWRIDFYGANPLSKRPKELVNKIYAQLLIAYADDKFLTIGANMYPPDIELKPFVSIYDRSARTSASIEGASKTVSNGNSSLVGRVDLKTIAKYCRGPLWVKATMGTQPKGAFANVESQSTVFYAEF